MKEEMKEEINEAVEMDDIRPVFARLRFVARLRFCCSTRGVGRAGGFPACLLCSPRVLFGPFCCSAPFVVRPGVFVLHALFVRPGFCSTRVLARLRFLARP